MLRYAKALAAGAMACFALGAQGADKPNILVVWGDDVGQSNISAYTMGMMGYRTPNIDRIAKEGMMFTDYYGEQSCTAGRSSFIMGQSVFRTGLSKVGLPGAELGMREEDPSIALQLQLLRDLLHHQLLTAQELDHLIEFQRVLRVLAGDHCTAAFTRLRVG